MTERQRNGRAILRAALAEYELSLLEKYPPENVSAEYSDEYKRNIDALIIKSRESEQKPKKRASLSFLRPVAIAAAALAIVIAFYATIAAVKEPVVEFLIDVYHSFVSNIWRGDDGDITDNHGTTTGTTAPLPDEPDIPEDIDANVSYGCDNGGFYNIKEYLNETGSIDIIQIQRLCSPGIWENDIIIHPEYDGEGEFEKAYIYDVSAPHKGKRTVSYTLFPLVNEEYDYKILNEYGRAQFYLKITENKSQNTVKTEIFDTAKRLKQKTEEEYYKNGKIKTRKSYYTHGSIMALLMYETKYNQDGNFEECLAYEQDSRTATKYSAKYNSLGTISEYIISNVFEPEDFEMKMSSYKFGADGRITEHDGIRYNYGSNGALKNIYGIYTEYTFNDKGFIIQDNYTNDSGFSTAKYVTYTYDQMNRIRSVTTTEKSFTEGTSTTSVSYIYNDDGSAIIYYKNKIGVTNRKVFTNKYGQPILDESYSSYDKLSGHTTYEYDEYGNLLDKREYSYEELKYQYLYEYDKYGDLIKETKVWISNGNILKQNTFYEYFANGELKLITTYDYWGVKSKVTEYYEDGSYKYTNYSSIDGRFINSNKYNRFGENTESVYAENGVEERNVYEYFENGREKKHFFYRNGVFQFGEEYDKNGNVIKTYEADDMGKIVCVESIKDKDGYLVRENIYENDIFVAYTLYEYFKNPKRTPVPVERILKYSANGELINYSEYKELEYDFFGTPNVNYVLVKEETYENGKIVAYKYFKYEEFTGNGKPVSHITKDGDKTSEAVYDENGNIFEEKFFENGVLVSLREQYNESSDWYFLTLYGENGLAVSKTLYDPHSEGIDVEGYELYEYYESGKLHFRKWFYTGYGKEYYLNNLYEYDESGYLVKEDQYTYNYEKLSRQYTYYYDDAGNKIQETFKSYWLEEGFEGRVSVNDTYYTYDENGILTEKADYYNNELSSREVYISIFYDNGQLKEYTQYGYNKYNQLSSTHITTYDEYGNELRDFFESIHAEDNSIIFSRETVHTYVELNGKKLLLEKVTTEKGVVTSMDKYQYHPNGQMSIWERYAWGKLIEEVRYDENGNRIFNW